MIRIIACVCLVLCLAGSELVRSQENKPNLTGRWVLNPSLTRPRTPPGFENKNRLVCCEIKSAIENITHKDPDLTITRNSLTVDNHGKEDVYESEIRLIADGNEVVIKSDGQETRRTTRWESGKLITYTVPGDKRFPPYIQVRSLSNNGKTMTLELYMLKIEGEPEETQVFERSDK